jgi:hypothetical protein
LWRKTGGRIDMVKLPIGDPTFLPKEISGNESRKEWDAGSGKKTIESYSGRECRTGEGTFTTWWDEDH